MTRDGRPDLAVELLEDFASATGFTSERTRGHVAGAPGDRPRDAGGVAGARRLPGDVGVPKGPDPGARVATLR